MVMPKAFGDRYTDCVGLAGLRFLRPFALEVRGCLEARADDRDVTGLVQVRVFERRDYQCSIVRKALRLGRVCERLPPVSRTFGTQPSKLRVGEQLLWVIGGTQDIHSHP